LSIRFNEDSDLLICPDSVFQVLSSFIDPFSEPARSIIEIVELILFSSFLREIQNTTWDLDESMFIFVENVFHVFFDFSNSVSKFSKFKIIGEIREGLKTYFPS